MGFRVNMWGFGCRVKVRFSVWGSRSLGGGFLSFGGGVGWGVTFLVFGGGGGLGCSVSFGGGCGFGLGLRPAPLSFLSLSRSFRVLGF